MQAILEKLFKKFEILMSHQEARAEAAETMHVICDRFQVQKDEILDRKLVKKNIDDFVEDVLRRRSLGEPLAYILGERAFYKDVFSVNRHVLIPRSDSEVIVEQALLHLSRKGGELVRVLDIGCGSGCLGLSILKYAKGVDLTLLDIDPQALEVADSNSKRISVEVKRVEFCQADVLQVQKNDINDLFGQLFDLIVSNPPYIAKGDPRLAESVSQYEPQLALYAEDSGLQFYQFFAENLGNWLKPEGVLLCEFSPEMKEAVENMFRSFSWKELRFYEDYTQRVRAFSVMKG